jgi:hypothetical protein
LNPGLHAIYSAGYRIEHARLINTHINGCSEKNDEQRRKNRDKHLSIEAEYQSILTNLGITNDRTAIEWINRIAPAIAKDQENYKLIIERQKTELDRFFSALKAARE